MIKSITCKVDHIYIGNGSTFGIWAISIFASSNKFMAVESHAFSGLPISELQVE